MSQYTSEYELHFEDNWKPVRPLEPFSFYTFTPRPFRVFRLLYLNRISSLHTVF